MRQRPLDRARPAEEAVADRLDMLAHDAQIGLLPQQVRHLLDDARARVLDGEHRRVDRAHRERLKRQPEGREADRLRLWKDRRDRLVGVRARSRLIGDFHPKMRRRIASATWLWSWSWSVTGGWPLPS